MSTQNPSGTAGVYQQANLPNIAPAQSYSPATAREPLLTSSFHTPGANPAGSPSQYASQRSQYAQPDPRYAAQSSPIHSRSQPTPAEILSTSQPATTAAHSLSSHPSPQPDHSTLSSANGYRSSSLIAQPVRPPPPYTQFCDHMRPQLEADNYPREHIQGRIEQEWRDLSPENRGLWDARYEEQMREYEDQMDLWKRAQRRAGEGTPGGTGVAGRGAGGFR